MQRIRSIFVLSKSRKLYDWRQRWVLHRFGAKDRRKMGTIYCKRRLASIYYAWTILPSDATKNREHLLVQVQSPATSWYFQICCWLHKVRTHIFRWIKRSFRYLVETRRIPSLLNQSIPFLPICACTYSRFLFVHCLIPVLGL